MSAAALHFPQPSASLTPRRAWRAATPEHGFMDRAGGASRDRYATMNLASWTGDQPAAVAENWRRWERVYPRLRAIYLNQVHGNSIVVVGPDTPNRLAADGMVSAARGLALCIFTADCAPLLMVDRARGIVGALHAGWRGTLADIAAAGVRAMVALGAHPDRIEAALGPTIGICCFEVDQALAERFAAELPTAAGHARAGRPGKAYLDLRGILTHQLIAAGLDSAKIIKVGPCTRCASAQFFSRRAAGGQVTGLQMSFIGYPA